MSEATFDFTSLQKVKRVITRETTARKADIGILRSKTKDKKTGTVSINFTISASLVKQMGLEVNSLETFKNAHGVYLAVCPGRTGEFFKNKEGEASKGNKFKNNELSNALDAEGFSGNSFNVTQIGAKDGKTYYKVIQAVASPVAVETTAPTKKEAVHA